MRNELADEEAKFGSAEHQPSVALYLTNRRALIQCAWYSTFSSTPLQATASARRCPVLEVSNDRLHVKTLEESDQPIGGSPLPDLLQ